MKWETATKQFKNYLKLERSLASNSIQAYLADISKLIRFLEIKERDLSPLKVKQTDLVDFIEFINELGLSRYSQARIISGIKAFYKYLVYEDLIIDDPSELIEGPKLGRKLPDTLSVHEIEALFEAIDHSKPEGVRNRAMLETLYSSGLRVSELIGLQISNIYLDIGFIRIIGKGNKERLVPIGSSALKHISLYREHVRVHLSPKAGHEDYLFLNKRGSQLSRVMVFMVIKDLAQKISLDKNISPHTFQTFLRNSFN